MFWSKQYCSTLCSIGHILQRGEKLVAGNNLTPLERGNLPNLCLKDLGHSLHDDALFKSEDDIENFFQY